MRNNIKYIVMHSTQTLSTELYHTIPYHYIIHRNGKVTEGKKLQPLDACLQIAYLGGVDKDKNVCDTKTDQQSKSLYKTLTTLLEKHPGAKIVGAHEIFGKSNDPGFDVRMFLKAYPSQKINSAA